MLLLLRSRARLFRWTLVPKLRFLPKLNRPLLGHVSAFKMSSTPAAVEPTEEGTTCKQPDSPDKESAVGGGASPEEGVKAPKPGVAMEGEEKPEGEKSIGEDKPEGEEKSDVGGEAAGGMEESGAKDKSVVEKAEKKKGTEGLKAEARGDPKGQGGEEGKHGGGGGGSPKAKPGYFRGFFSRFLSQGPPEPVRGTV